MSERVGYAPGVYEMFHVGHLNILRRAKEHCDCLVARVVSDAMCEPAKGREPIIPQAERPQIVQHVSYMDETIIDVVLDKLVTWESVRFDVIFKGDDWRGTLKGRRLKRDLARVGVEVVHFPYTARTSSSMLRRVLSEVIAEPEREVATG